MTIWVIVFSLSATLAGVPILPSERPQGFLTKPDCVSKIPEMKRRWEAMSLPAPLKVTCEILEMQIK